MEFGNVLPYTITIKGSSNKGFIVKIGCCTCVFTDEAVMLDAIQEYLDNPDKMEKEYNKTRIGSEPIQTCESGGCNIRCS